MYYSNAYMMVYFVRNLNYCSVEYYYAHVTHALLMSYGFVTILVHKNYSYATIPYVTFYDSYRNYI